MIYSNFKDFINVLAARGKLLALDWGAKRTGVAISDATREFVFLRPQVLPDAEKIADFAKAEFAVGIILGLPPAGQTATRVMEFAAALAALTDTPILMMDENLTSSAATYRLSENGIDTRHQKNKLDSMAAMIMLEEFIERLKNAK